MAGVVGKSGRNSSKQIVIQSNFPGTGFKNIRALHTANSGDAFINITSLTPPSIAIANGYVAPSPSDLQKVSLLQFKQNVILKTEFTTLLQDVHYTIIGSKTIRLTNLAGPGQIYELIINAEPRIGTPLADARPLVVTGVLPSGSTDFNVGFPFEVGKFPFHTLGAVSVFVDGTLARRNVGNQPGGSEDYYELHAGAGLGTIIRFNASVGSNRNITVVSVGSLVERPNGSQDALIDTLAGQIDVIRAEVEAQHGITIPIGAPNNLDLKAFGDRVLALEQAGGGGGAVTSVNGQTGVVVLDPDDLNDAATTNKFTTAGDISKLAGIEAGATADQTDPEIETAYNNQVPIVSQADAEAGTSTTVNRWTPQRVGQAIAALGGGGGGYDTFQDEGVAQTQRTTVDFQGAGVTVTDNGTNTVVTVPGGVPRGFVYDDFVGGNFSSGNIGDLNWTHNLQGGQLYPDAPVGHLGIYERTTTGVYSSTFLNLSSTAGLLNPLDTFENNWNAQVPINDASLITRFGASDDAASNNPNNGIYIEKLGPDTNWFGVCRSGGVETRVDLGAVDLLYHDFRIRRVNVSTIGFRIDGGTELTITTNIPTVNLIPFFGVESLGGTRSLAVDYFSLGIAV